MLKESPGTVNVVSVGGAHTIVLVVAHEAAGQRDLSMPGVRESITETLRARKEQLLRAAYLTAVRERCQGGELPGAPAGRVARQNGSPDAFSAEWKVGARAALGLSDANGRRRLSRPGVAGRSGNRL